MTADNDNLHVGSVVPVKFAQTGPTTMRIGGIFKPNPLVGSFVVGDAVLPLALRQPTPDRRPAEHGAGRHGSGPGAQHRAVAVRERRLQDAGPVRAGAAERASTSCSGSSTCCSRWRSLVALIGIVNTLMLSVFERTHEIGLLRAVGMRRRQVRAMIRSESVIIAPVRRRHRHRASAPGWASRWRRRCATAASPTSPIPVASLIGFLILSGAAGAGRRHLAGAPSGQARRAGRDRGRVTEGLPRHARAHRCCAVPRRLGGLGLVEVDE